MPLTGHDRELQRAWRQDLTTSTDGGTATDHQTLANRENAACHPQYALDTELESHTQDAGVHHSRGHPLISTADHLVSGLTPGYYLRAKSATELEWAAVNPGEVDWTDVRLGTGDFTSGSPYTGLRVFTESNIGRLAAYHDAGAEATLSCPDGYELNEAGTACVSTSTVTAKRAFLWVQENNTQTAANRQTIVNMAHLGGFTDILAHGHTGSDGAILSDLVAKAHAQTPPIKVHWWWTPNTLGQLQESDGNANHIGPAGNTRYCVCHHPEAQAGGHYPELAKIHWADYSSQQVRDALYTKTLQNVCPTGVDGVHLDYFRYPDGSTCENYFGANFRFWPMFHDHIGDDNVIEGALVYVQNAVNAYNTAHNTHIELSCAVGHRYDWIYEYTPGNQNTGTTMQFWDKWLTNNHIDFVITMNYWAPADDDHYQTCLDWHMNVANALGDHTRIYEGLGLEDATDSSPVVKTSAQLITQINEAFNYETVGFPGYGLFDDVDFFARIASGSQVAYLQALAANMPAPVPDEVPPIVGGTNPQWFTDPDDASLHFGIDGADIGVGKMAADGLTITADADYHASRAIKFVDAAGHVAKIYAKGGASSIELVLEADTITGGGSAGAWTDWTPTLAQGSTTFGLTVGEAKYILNGKLCTIYMDATVASGTGQSGTFSMKIGGIPAAAQPAHTGNYPIGQGMVLDANGLVYTGAVCAYGAAEFRIFINGNSEYFGYTPDIDLTTGDSVSFTATYRIA